MKRFSLLFLIILILWGCNPKAPLKTSVALPTEPIEVEISYLPQDLMEFKVINLSDSTVFIHHYYKLHIEWQKDESWIPLRILSCPCGAPCARPAEFVGISGGENFVWEWDMQESWCGDLDESLIPKTLNFKISPGVYRVRVVYGFGLKDIFNYYKSFTIK